MRPRGELGDAVRTLVDLLIPGGGARWPTASAAIEAHRLDALLGEDAPAFAGLASAVFEHPSPRRETALRGRATAAPAAFGRYLDAVYGAYYSSPAVQPALRALADASPREPSAHVDPGLVAAVSLFARGARRL